MYLKLKETAKRIVIVSGFLLLIDCIFLKRFDNLRTIPPMVYILLMVDIFSVIKGKWFYLSFYLINNLIIFGYFLSQESGTKNIGSSIFLGMFFGSLLFGVGYLVSVVRERIS